MGKTSGILFLLSTLLLLPACGKDSRVRDALFQGIYESGSQVQQMENPEAIKPPPTIEKPETYGQYKRERDASMEDKDAVVPLEKDNDLASPPLTSE